MNTVILLSLLILLLSAVLIFLFFRYVFRPNLKKRKQYIDRLESSESVATSSPLKRPLKVFKARAKKSLSLRFSIFRRTIIVVSLTLVTLVLLFPYFDVIPQTVISVLVGSSAIIVGIAARPFIENFLSGIAITISKKLNIGDTILIDNAYGTIEDISSTHTIIKLWNWKRYVIPNSRMINEKFTNFSLYDQWIWTHIEFYVSYDTNLKHLKNLAETVALESPHRSNIESPTMWVVDQQKDAIRCWLAAWADSPELAWELRSDLRIRLITAFQENNIDAYLSQVKVRGKQEAFSGEVHPETLEADS
ncbi:MAG TPA: mechanosensitive ion channel domain-containing protein [Saprospiraceae bacterium]|nr:mechanosensitive ion channel domain-containing protein [Saprospiraceae bacterium]